MLGSPPLADVREVPECSGQLLEICLAPPQRGQPAAAWRRGPPTGTNDDWKFILRMLTSRA